VSDVWQIARRVSLNYGVRWEPNLPINKTEGIRLERFSLANYQNGIRSTVYPKAPAGLFFQGDQWWEPKGRGSYHPDWWNFSPRVGVAWDVMGNGLTSVRGSYNVIYEMPGTLGSLYGGSGASYTVNNPSGGFENPWSDFPGGNPFPMDPSDPGVFTQASGTIGSFDRPASKINNWTISIQRQIPGDFLVTASYIGSKTSNLWRSRGLNDSVFVPGVGDANRQCFFNGKAVPYTVNPGTACSTTGNSDSRRPLSLENPAMTLGNISVNTDDGTSRYNGLLLSVQRRATAGVNVGANYTWSRCIEDYVKNGEKALFVFDTDPVTKQLPLEYGNCAADRASDVRQMFNLTSVVSTPEFASPKLRLLASGWRLSALFKRSTGIYYSLINGVNRALGAGTAERPNQVLVDPYLDKKGKGIQYLNPAAFQLPALGPIGNVGPGTIEGPPAWAFDMAISRSFQMREEQRLEIRAEAFNVTNSLRREFTVITQRDRPALSLNSNLFGQLNASRDPRIIQLAVKYVF
jgi:hypothetical protein